MLYWDVTSSTCQQIKSSMSIWTKLWSILMTLWCATPVLKNMRSINDWFSDVKESSVICEIGDVLIYTEENQVPWSHQWTWSYKLGHGESEVHPRVEGTHQCEELRSFLRWAIYYNIFVEGYYKRTTSLTELLKKGVTWTWNDQCHKSFKDVKEVMKDLVLGLSDMNKPFEVKTDVFDFTLGGVML